MIRTLNHRNETGAVMTTLPDLAVDDDGVLDLLAWLRVFPGVLRSTNLSQSSVVVIQEVRTTDDNPNRYFDEGNGVFISDLLVRGNETWAQP